MLGSGTEAEEETVFGAPRTHDGHLYPVYPFFVGHLLDIPKEGWEHILKSTALTWVIIPQERWDGRKVGKG